MRQFWKTLMKGASVVPTHGSVNIRDTGETLLFKLTNYLNNFPSKVILLSCTCMQNLTLPYDLFYQEGVSVMTSQITEVDDVDEGSADLSKCLIFLFNQSSILSLVQLPPSSPEAQPVARMILRDSTGQYCHMATKFSIELFKSLYTLILHRQIHVGLLNDLQFSLLKSF